MRGLRNIILTTALVASFSGITYAAEDWERKRLIEQPDVGEITENVMENDFFEKCNDDNNYTLFETSIGNLFFESDKKEKPYVELNEDGTIKQNPWVFYDKTTKKVYVNMDYMKDNLYDFEQPSSRQKPCGVFTNLDNYIVKD